MSFLVFCFFFKLCDGVVWIWVVLVGGLPIVITLGFGFFVLILVLLKGR